jgi:hypothetical protein
MDAPPETPVISGADTVVIADAYQLFWDCVENDVPAGADMSPADSDAADAYRQFWDVNEM